MRIRRLVVGMIAATAVATGCGVYADSNGQVCVIIIGIPICQTAS